MLSFLPFIGLILSFCGIFLTLYQREFTLISLGILSIGVILSSIIFSSKISNKIKRLFFSLTTSFSILVSFIIIFLISLNHHQRFDLTENKVFTLSPISSEILKQVDIPVDIIAFYTNKDKIEPLLEQYALSSKNIKYEIHDPVKDPLFVRKYSDKVLSETIFLISGDKKKKIVEVDEEKITNGILDIIRSQDIIIYFLQGHNEKEIEVQDEKLLEETDLSQTITAFGKELNAQGYKIKTLNLSRTGVIPSDCNLLIVAGPGFDLFTGEPDLISNYVESGGSCFFLLDPVLTQLKTDVNFKSLLKDFNIILDNNIILDMSFVGKQIASNYSTPIVDNFSDHPITKDLANLKVPIAFPIARPITIKNTESFTIKPLLITDEQSWKESVDNVIKTGGFKTPEKEQLHKQVVAAAIEKKIEQNDAKGKIVIVGDSDTFSDKFISPISTQFFINSVKWLTGEEKFIPIAPRKRSETLVIIAESEINILLFILVVLIPLSITILGLSYTIWRRKNR